MKEINTTIYRLYATIAVRIPRDILNDSTFDKSILNTQLKYPIAWNEKTKQITIDLGKGIKKEKK